MNVRRAELSWAIAFRMQQALTRPDTKAVLSAAGMRCDDAAIQENTSRLDDQTSYALPPLSFASLPDHPVPLSYHFQWWVAEEGRPD
jgi:hypothetical protein